LLRLGGQAQRKEHSAKREERDFFVHEFFLPIFIFNFCFTGLGFAVRIKQLEQFELVERAQFPLFDHRVG
jgi:hypothetical protein